MSLATRGQRLLNRGKKDAEGVSVTYTRSPLSATVTGWTGTRDVDEVTQPTQQGRSADRERDYLFELADLTAAGFGEPAEGDRITETINGTARVFEAFRRDREPAWVYSDRERTRVRVHTRKVG